MKKKLNIEFEIEGTSVPNLIDNEKKMKEFLSNPKAVKKFLDNYNKLKMFL